MTCNIKTFFRSAVLSLLVVAISCATSVTAIAGGDEAETVMVTYRAKAGREVALMQVITRHWSTVRRLNLVRESPHLVVRNHEGGNVLLIELFTWRSASIADHAPKEIQRLWSEMSEFVESRDGRPGIGITQVEIVDR